jgi:hypothetical protein
MEYGPEGFKGDWKYEQDIRETKEFIFFFLVIWRFLSFFILIFKLIFKVPSPGALSVYYSRA